MPHRDDLNSTPRNISITRCHCFVPAGSLRYTPVPNKERALSWLLLYILIYFLLFCFMVYVWLRRRGGCHNILTIFVSLCMYVYKALWAHQRHGDNQMYQITLYNNTGTYLTPRTPALCSFGIERSENTSVTGY